MLTAIATLSKPLQLAKHGMNLWRKRRLSGASIEAMAALGECMFAAGIDDGELGAKIRALDEQLRPGRSSQAPQALTAARRHGSNRRRPWRTTGRCLVPTLRTGMREAQAAVDWHEGRGCCAGPSEDSKNPYCG